MATTVTTFLIAYEVQHDDSIDRSELGEVVQSYFDHGTVRDGIQLAAEGHEDRAQSGPPQWDEEIGDHISPWSGVEQYGAGIVFTYGGEPPDREAIALAMLSRAGD